MERLGRVLKQCALLAAILVLTACGGGGGSGGGAGSGAGNGGTPAPSDPLTYSGSESQAALTPTNASRFADVVFGGSGVSGDVTALSAPSDPRSTAAGVRRSVHVRGIAGRIVAALRSPGQRARAAGVASATAAGDIDDTRNCDHGGTAHVVGHVDERGVGALTLTFNACADGSGASAMTGTVQVSVRAVDQASGIPLDVGASFTDLHVVTSSRTQRLRGRFDDLYDIFTGTDSLTMNLTLLDSSVSALTDLRNFVHTTRDDSLGFTESYQGRVYFADLGYVDVSTVSVFTSVNSSAQFPDHGGPLTLRGRGGSRVVVTALTNERLHFEVDSNGDNAFDASSWVTWRELGTSSATNLADSDGDGMHDSWETAHGLNPAQASDANDDPDGDGITTQVEYWGGSSPNDATSKPPTTKSPAGGFWKPPATAVPASGTYLYLDSDPQEQIVGGQRYLYLAADTLIAVAANRGQVSVRVNGDQTWTGTFVVPDDPAQLQPGQYAGLHSTSSPPQGRIAWSGRFSECVGEGWFVIDGVTYVNGSLTTLDLRFEYQCSGFAPVLHGKLHWDVNDAAVVAAPVNPIPSDLWQPQSTPAESASYVVVETGGAFGAHRYEYTQANADLNLQAQDNGARVTVFGNSTSQGDFVPMNTLTMLQPGYYANLHGYPFHIPERGGLRWLGPNTVGCERLRGWFTVDAVTYTLGEISAADIRFEERCVGSDAVVHGKVHWLRDDATRPTGPINPPPQDYWQPPTGSTPASGSYIYLASEPGDFVGAGQTLLFTPRDSVLSVTATNGMLQVHVVAEATWFGSFATMDTVREMQPGYYGALQRFPFHNHARGGLDWSGDSRGCNTLSGSFVVDSATYVNGNLTAIDLRFEQHCEGGTSALHGKIHWDANDGSVPPGPVNPPPEGLWRPPVGATPDTGTYVYLASDSEDFVGSGRTYLFTPADHTISVSTFMSGVHVSTGAPENANGDFVTMNSVNALIPGYYGDLVRFPFNNPAKGGLSWTMSSQGCNRLTGWFVVDDSTYVAGELTAITLRFEQHCEGVVPALHGAIRWTKPLTQGVSIPRPATGQQVIRRNR